MEIRTLHNKHQILSFFNTNPELQVYCIGDLDDFFWKKTIWYALAENDNIKSIALLYVGMQTPTLLLFDETKKNYSQKLLEQIKSYLPQKFYAHLSPNLVDVFDRKNVIESYGLTYKMALKSSTIQSIDDKNVRRLTVSDLPKIKTFYKVAYPENWFDQRMLETGKYFGYFSDNKLVGISGIHVYSAEYKVAALGNIATHPDFRGQGIAYKLTAKLCKDLSKTVDVIGLNVKADNEAAINCYRKLGFEVVGTYEEFFLRNN